MQHSFKNSLMFIMITLALLAGALGVTPAFADDETPPPPATEEVVLPPTEEPTQLPVVDAELLAESTPVPELPQETLPAGDAGGPVTELLSEVPEGMDVVALDDDGEALPLASQDAAEVLVEADPKWCPEGVLPNGAACSVNFPSIADLLKDMRDNRGFYSADGVIYFERQSVTIFTSPFILDDSASSLGAAYDTLKVHNITLAGGWVGGTSAYVNGTTLFKDPNAFIQVGMNTNPWVGNVTLQDIQVGINGTSPVGVSASNSLTVYTSDGDITLTDVDVYRQEGEHYTAYLQSTNGDITVSSGSLFDGNNATGQSNKGFFAATGSGSISISNTTFQQALGPSGTNYNGATLSAPTVNLTNVASKSNDGSGIYVNGTGSTIVNVFGGTFNNNKEFGLKVTGSILNQKSAPTCTGNTLGCYNVTPNSTPTVVVNNVQVEANTLGGWTLTFNAIGSASDTEDGTPSVSCTPASGSLLPLGTTTVSCTVTDRGGLTDSAFGKVTVVDTTAPSLSIPSGMTVAATSPAGADVTFAASATDVVSGGVSVICKPPTGTAFPFGNTVVNCLARDGSGNQATGSFRVTVKDMGAPTLTLPADISLMVNYSDDAVVTYSASAADFIEGSLPVTCTPASGSIFPDGTTTVKCSATDSAGNTSIGYFSVTVDLDRIPEPPLYSLVEQQKDQLPGKVEQGYTFGSALKLEFFNRGPKGGVTLSFIIPAGMQDAKLAVMFWDGSKWATLSGGSVAGDYFVIKVTKPGTYMLIGQ